MRKFVPLLIGVLSALITVPGAFAEPTPDQAPLGPVDFRYSPPWWQTLVCLPDDPDKVLVGKDGQLLFDWSIIGPNGYDRSIPGLKRFAVVLQPDLAGGSRWLRQTTVSPRAPIVQTVREAGRVEMTEEAFVIPGGPPTETALPRLARVDVQLSMFNWAKPARPCSGVFADGVIAGLGKPIHFQLSVIPGAEVTLVYGICEGRYSKIGQRVLTLSAEGSPTMVVDPVKDFGPNTPGVYRMRACDENRDGIINIYVGTPPDPPNQDAVLNALWVFTGASPPDQAIIAGRADGSAYACYPKIFEPTRREVILVTITNRAVTPATCQPVLRINSSSPVTADEQHQSVLVGNGTRISGSAPLGPSRSEVAGETVAEMPAVTLAGGASREFVFTVDRHSTAVGKPVSPDEARKLRAAALAWWEHFDLPYAAVEVPDRGIQNMLESCVRNIWQARELSVDGPAYHVGPTAYRGLWVADGAFILETVALLGRGRESRAGIEHLLGRQNPDGSFTEIPRYWKEDGIVLWAATRHAFLTQDKEWLRSHWAALCRVMEAIRRLRDEASKDPASLNYRLLPAGMVDGGIGDNGSDPDYSNILWTLAGMKSAVAGAHWLGDEGRGTAWQKEYDDFYEVFRAACARDTLKDGHGNAYVPAMMADAKHYVPQKGQWAFCHAVYPGQVFLGNDAYVEGQLAMLRDTEVEGMVSDTGWLQGGLWTYFASFYGHAQLWLGHGRIAAAALYAFANHACPTRVWREEQMPLGLNTGTDDIGDMPHNWASAEFVRLATHLIELDRGNELHLLEGFPREWAGAGMVTRLNGVFTPFGPLHLEVKVSDDGQTLRVRVQRLVGSPPSRLVLHLEGLGCPNGVVELPVDRDIDRNFQIRSKN